MSSDPSLREEAFPYFVNEATDLLQNIEQDLLSLREDRTSARVHSLMRYAHTLKGAAATVGLETVKHVAHVLEDVFRALYNPDIDIDDEVEALLFEGYDCLRTPLMAEINGSSVDESDIFNRAAAIISRLQDKLGDLFDRETPIPTAEELGFDVVKSMFEVGVEQRLTDLSAQLENGTATADIASQLQTTCEVFLGLAESLQLPGFGGIAQLTLQGLETQADNPALLRQAYEDLRAGQQLVLAGDREQGGQASDALMALVAGGTAAAAVSSNQVVGTSETADNISNDSLPENLDIGGLEGLFGGISNADMPEGAVSEPSPVTEAGSAQAAGAVTDSSATGDLPDLLDGQLDALFNDVDDPDRDVTVPDLSAMAPAGIPPAGIPAAQAFASPEAENPAVAPPAADQPAGDKPLASLDDLFGGVEPLVIADTFTSEEDAEAATAEAATAKAAATQAPTTAPSQPSPSIAASSPKPQAAAAAAQSLAAKPSPSATKTTAPSAAQTAAAIAISQAPTEKPATPSQKRSNKSATLISSGSTKLSRGRESKVTMRVGLDQVLRLDHLVGELLTNQIQSSEQDDQLRQGILELLSQLRNHRRTLSDLQSAAQQIGTDEWGFSLAQRDADALASIALKPKKTKKAKATKASLAIPELPLSEQFDTLEMDRYGDLQIVTQKALNEAVQLEIVIEALEQQTKQNRQICDGRQRLFRQLRDDLASVRLKAVGELFNRFPRVLQQLSTTYGKQVELGVFGKHVLIDKITLDSLYDSLLHLIRNAFDHGIETPEEREAAGKSPKGRIELSAYQQGNRTVIEIRDDGKGVNLERIAEKAIAQELLSATEVEDVTEGQLLELMFHPGFSTAESVSDLSGRGVGLDVVRSQIESLDGNLSIRSEAGKGTSFILQFPLSVTITKQLICRSQGTTYAIAADAIEQVMLPRGEQLRSLNDGRQVLTLRQGDSDAIIPVLNLSELVDYVHPPSGSDDGSLSVMQPVLLVACSDGLRGIQVDQVLGEQELSIRAMGSVVEPPAYIQGCTVLGDAHLALAIEPSLLLEQACGDSQGQASSITLKRRESSPAKPAGERVPRVLIIDDSLTQRRTLERTLKSVGYEVIQAEDGLDAMVSLKKNSDVDLIFCDLEMPRMNGFEFLSQSRTIEGIKGVPISILTSRSGGKYRQLAMELGATEFLSKPYTDYELLNTAAQLLEKKLAVKS